MVSENLSLSKFRAEVVGGSISGDNEEPLGVWGRGGGEGEQVFWADGKWQTHVGCWGDLILPSAGLFSAFEEQ